MSDYDAEEYESFELGQQPDPATPEPEDDDAEPETDDFDDPDDAEDDEIDLVVAAYREDGAPVARALTKEFANDLDGLIVELRRLPGDAGAIGLVSLVGEMFAIVRVRGRMVQVLLSDAAAVFDWPIARDIADYLGETDIDADSDEVEPLGDLGLLSDIGISELELETYCAELDDDADSDDLVLDIADKIGFGRAVRHVVESEF